MSFVLTKAGVPGRIGERPKARKTSEAPNKARIRFPIKTTEADDSPGFGSISFNRQTSWTIKAHGKGKVQTPRPNLKSPRDNKRIDAAINMSGGQFVYCWMQIRRATYGKEGFPTPKWTPAKLGLLISTTYALPAMAVQLLQLFPVSLRPFGPVPVHAVLALDPIALPFSSAEVFPCRLPNSSVARLRATSVEDPTRYHGPTSAIRSLALFVSSDNQALKLPLKLAAWACILHRLSAPASPPKLQVK